MLTTACLAQEHIINVRQRPHLLCFMERVAQLFEVVVFTASQKIYAEVRTCVFMRVCVHVCVYVCVCACVCVCVYTVCCVGTARRPGVWSLPLA